MRAGPAGRSGAAAAHMAKLLQDLLELLVADEQVAHARILLQQAPEELAELHRRAAGLTGGVVWRVGQVVPGGPAAVTPRGHEDGSEQFPRMPPLDLPKTSKFFCRKVGVAISMPGSTSLGPLARPADLNQQTLERRAGKGAQRDLCKENSEKNYSILAISAMKAAYCVSTCSTVFCAQRPRRCPGNCADRWVIRPGARRAALTFAGALFSINGAAPIAASGRGTAASTDDPARTRGRGFGLLASLLASRCAGTMEVRFCGPRPSNGWGPLDPGRAWPPADPPRRVPPPCRAVPAAPRWARTTGRVRVSAPGHATGRGPRLAPQRARPGRGGPA